MLHPLDISDETGMQMFPDGNGGIASREFLLSMRIFGCLKRTIIFLTIGLQALQQHYTDSASSLNPNRTG